jgi:hypothetical protein
VEGRVCNVFYTWYLFLLVMMQCDWSKNVADI